MFQVTKELKDLKERMTVMEEELRINNRQLDKSNSNKQKLERDLDEVSVQLCLVIVALFVCYEMNPGIFFAAPC